jgi:molecular chaperone GrpE
MMEQDEGKRHETGAPDPDSGDAAPDVNPDAGHGDAPNGTAEQVLAAAAAERIKALEAEVTELKDRSLRALADAENTRRRAQRETADARKFGPGGLAKDLLNVSDNLRRALDSVPGDLRASDEQINNLMTGVEMVEKEFLSAFGKNGITKIEPLGEPFNHDLHQAMYEVEGTGKPAGTVVEMLQPGFLLHDRLLRPAMVAIAKGQPEAPTDDVERVDTTA